MIDQFIKPDSWTARDLYAAFALAGSPTRWLR